MNWDDLKLLHYVSKEGSFYKAAEVLGTTASTVSRRISKLESDLSELLVERSIDGVRLTSKGREFAKLASSMLKLVEAKMEKHNCGQREPSGTVTVTATYSRFDQITMIASQFIKQYPDCRVDFEASSRKLDIAGGEADIAFRMGRGHEASLIYKKVAEVGRGFFTTRKYLDSLEKELTPQNVDFIYWVAGMHDAPLQWITEEKGFTNVRFRSSMEKAVVQAVRQGLGVAAIAKTEGLGLVEVFQDIPLPTVDMYLVTRPQALKQPHIRAFADVVYGFYEKYRDLLKHGDLAQMEESLVEMGFDSVAEVMKKQE